MSTPNVELFKQATRRVCEESGEPWPDDADAEFDDPNVSRMADVFAELVQAAKTPKPDHMTDEAWRQLTEVIPFRMRQVKMGNHMSLAVMMESIDKIAGELGIQGDVRRGHWPTIEATAELEQEARLMRARMERLQAERTHVIQLTSAEVQSGHDRVKWAEGLIRQLPEGHDGRNSWLLNYGSDKDQRQAEWARRHGKTLP